jgi:hypothetical protein
MDVETCWRWFDDVFAPEVRKRTGRRVLLLMDNAPGHFEAFEKDNITIAFFPPNCTSWKQPCYMGIIAALKKLYKYLYLKDVLGFYELEEDVKRRKREQGERLRRGSAGVTYGNPAHLLDAAMYVKEAWNAVSSSSIRNAFKKAEIMMLPEESEETVSEVDEDNYSLLNLASAFEEMRVSLDSSVLEEFIHIDDEDNEEYAVEVLEDVEEMMDTMKLDEILENDENDCDLVEVDCTTVA